MITFPRGVSSITILFFKESSFSVDNSSHGSGISLNSFKYFSTKGISGFSGITWLSSSLSSMPRRRSTALNNAPRKKECFGIFCVDSITSFGTTSKYSFTASNKSAKHSSVLVTYPNIIINSYTTAYPI